MESLLKTKTKSKLTNQNIQDELAAFGLNKNQTLFKHISDVMNDTNETKEIEEIKEMSKREHTPELQLKEIKEQKENIEKLKQINFKSFFRHKHFEYIENLLNAKMNSIIFDTEKDNWNIRTSEFEKRIVNKKCLLFYIEFDKNIKIIFYLPETIKKVNKTYSNSKEKHIICLISKNSITIPTLEKSDLDFTIFEENSSELFTIGKTILSIKKESKKVQSTIDYNKIHIFTTIPKRITVFQLIPLKLGIHTLSSRQRQIIEEWTLLKIKEVILDVGKLELQSMNEITSLILNKSHLLFIIETYDNEEQRLFGWYIHSQIQHEGFLYDSNAFLFTIDKKKQMIKFSIKPEKSQYAFWISPSFDSRFIQVGMDIKIMKNDILSSCWQDDTSIYQYSQNDLHSSSLSESFDINSFVSIIDHSDENNNILCGITGDECLCITKLVILQLE